VRIYIDLDQCAVISDLTLPRALGNLDLKRGDNINIDVVFVQDGVAQELDASGPAATGELGVKANGAYAGGFLASALSWAKSGTGTNTVYAFALNLNTDEINTAFTAEPDSIPAMLEVQWIIGSIITSCATLPVTIHNDVIRGDEGVPTAGTPAYPPPDMVPRFYPGITGLTGGGSTKLDGITTAGVDLGVVACCVISGVLEFWQLQAGAASGGDVAPADYDPASNNKKWALLPAISQPTQHAVGAIAGNTTLDLSNGALQTATATGDTTLEPPANPLAGAKLEIWLSSSGVNLSLDPSISIPSASSFASPFALEAGTYILLLKYNGVKWMLASFVGAYT